MGSAGGYGICLRAGSGGRVATGEGSVPGRVGSVFAEGLESVARSRKVEGLTVIRVGLVTGRVVLMVVWTRPSALGVGLLVG